MNSFFSWVENNFRLYYFLCVCAGITIRLLMAGGPTGDFWNPFWYPLFN